MLHPEIVHYLRDMITPGPDQGIEGVFVHAGSDYDWTQHEDASVHGIVLEDAEGIEEAYRVLKPGGHLMLAAPDDQPTGHTGACMAEDLGFEVRDAICIPGPGDGDKIHYVPKASRSEREEGLKHLPEKVFGMSGGAQGAIAAAEALAEEEGEEMDEADYEAAQTIGLNRVVKRRNVHPCLHPDALVMTEHGYRPISEIQVGNKVYSADGRFHAVEHVSRHPYTSPDLYEINVMGTNYKTLASDNHPFLIWRPTRNGKRITGGEVHWLRADQIQKGDYTMTPDLAEPKRTASSQEDLDWWFVFGLWVAEGIVQRSGHGGQSYPSFTLNEAETDLIEKIKKVFAHVNTGVYPKPGARAVQVVSFDPLAGPRFVELAGRGASTKQLCPSIWKQPREVRRAVVEGYLAGDGGKVRTYIQAKTVSPDLASQMRLLAASVGYKANLFTYAPVTGKGIGDRIFKNVRRSYQIRLYSDNANHKKNGTRKPSRPQEVIHKGVRYVLSYVRGVEKVPYEGDVVNLSVKGSPTFQTAVGMSHNTVKPVAVMERLLADVPKDQGPIVDPFMGSGTTGIACLSTGHDFIGIEREEEYLLIAEGRVRHWNVRTAAWDTARVTSDLTAYEEAAEAEPETLSLDDLFGL